MRNNLTIRDKYRRWVSVIVVNIFVVVLLILMIEGVSSYYLVAKDAMNTGSIAERRHTRYDPDLGWINIPNVTITDMYGPGVALRINGQGFRNDHDFDVSVPSGKIRIICSGDSFTLGYGVSNTSTWCQRLINLDPRLETVNMGQGGYGVDQAYLWYMRDGSTLKHDVQILAFITGDFYRMQRSNFLGYGKPVMALDDGKLVVKNTPVPRTPYTWSYLTSKTGAISKLRTLELVNKVARKTGLVSDGNTQAGNENRDNQTREILLKIFETLDSSNKEHHSKLILVYLPTLNAVKNPSSSEEWAGFVANAAKSLGIPFINIMGKFQSMRYEDAARLFIAEGKLRYPGAAGHLNEAGNDIVAKMIYEELVEYLPHSR